MKNFSCIAAALISLLSSTAADPLDDAFRGIDEEVKKESRDVIDIESAFDEADRLRISAWSEKIVAAIETLANRWRAANEQVVSIGKAIESTNQQIAAAEKELEANMNDFKKGLFCSGCMNTRTQILATGSTFPHPNQSVIQKAPSDAELLEQRQKLMKPIDELRRQRAIREEELALVYKTQGEIPSQLSLGVNLWRTTSTFEENHLGVFIGERMVKNTKTISGMLADVTRLREQYPVDQDKIASLNDSLSKAGKRETAEKSASSQSINKLEERREAHSQRIAIAIKSCGADWRIVGIGALYQRKATGAAPSELGDGFLLGLLDGVDSPGTIQIEEKQVDLHIAGFRDSDVPISAHGWRGWSFTPTRVR